VAMPVSHWQTSLTLLPVIYVDLIWGPGSFCDEFELVGEQFQVRASFNKPTKCQTSQNEREQMRLGMSENKLKQVVTSRNEQKQTRNKLEQGDNEPIQVMTNP